MALAATENAKVCTSVRSKYFTVEIASPEESLSTPGREPGAGGTGAGDGDGKGCGTVRLSHLIKELRSVTVPPAGPPRTPGLPPGRMADVAPAAARRGLG
jgi:hypothetical protein